MELVKRISAVAPVSDPVISVCIANYNGSEVLKNCLDSVFAQHCRCNVEVIVHDDASTDDGLTALLSDYDQVEFLLSSTNVGFCVSNNRMVSVARGTFILLLNNDAQLLEGALESLLRHALGQRRQGVLTLPQFDADNGELIDRGMKLDMFMNPVPNLAVNAPIATCIGACLWLPRELWLECGGFPEWFESIAEDVFLCSYARLLGHSVESVDVSGYLHINGHSFGGGKARDNKLSTSLARRRLSERNKTFVMICTYPLVPLMVVLPLHLMTLLLEGIILGILKLTPGIFVSVYWNVLREVFRYRVRLKEARRQMQANRRVSIPTFFRPFQLLPHKLALLGKHGVPEIK